MPTVRVEQDVFEYLLLQKHGKDIMSDVVRRLIGMGRTPPGPESQPAPPRRGRGSTRPAAPGGA